MSDDLFDDAFAGSGNAVPAIDVNLAEDWDELKCLPKYLYTVIKGYGWESMELWRVRCLDQGRDIRGPRVVDCWVYKYDRCLWGGVDARLDRRKGPFKGMKSNFHRTLDAALIEFDAIWNEHLNCARDSEKLLRGELAAVQTRIAVLCKRIEEHEAGPSDHHVATMARIEDASGHE